MPVSRPEGAKRPVYPGVAAEWAPDPSLVSLVESARQQLPEIVIGVARSQGADVRKTTLMALQDELRAKFYFPYVVEVSDLIQKAAQDLSNDVDLEVNAGPGGWTRPMLRVRGLMGWGDILRAAIHPSVAAMMAIAEIQTQRSEINIRARDANMRGIAYIVRTLVQPAEVSRLRSVYKQRFFMIAIHEDGETRRQNLIHKLQEDGEHPTEAQLAAVELMQIDDGVASSGSASDPSAMNVVETFDHADVYLTVGRDRTLKRFVRQLFGDPHGAPTVPELGMAFAYLAAKQSVALGRSVGSAIVNSRGDLLAVGWNEPAAPSGGNYRQASPSTFDGRDHTRGFDPSDRQRISAIFEFLHLVASLEYENLADDAGLPQQALVERGELVDILSAVAPRLRDLDRRHARALPSIRELSGARLLNLIEFGRSVHAEMAAVTDAARRGIALEGTHMFVTTFPCHECARNLVASGIRSLTYVQPYQKSLARDLYDDSIDFRTSPTDPTAWGSASGTGGSDHKVIFAPFEGISPKRFDELFSALPRKYSLSEVAAGVTTEEGASVRWPLTSHEHVLRQSIRGYADSDFDPNFEVARQLAEQSVVDVLLARYKDYKAGRINRDFLTDPE